MDNTHSLPSETSGPAAQTQPQTSLVDIADIKIDPSLSREDRIRSYLQQINNPYMFSSNGMVVKIAFSKTDATIEDRLAEYIQRKSKVNLLK